jgi:hypothetical protein
MDRWPFETGGTMESNPWLAKLGARPNGYSFYSPVPDCDERRCVGAVTGDG